MKSHLSRSAPIKNKTKKKKKEKKKRERGKAYPVCLFHQTRQQNPMLLFPNDGCLCRMCVMGRRLLAHAC